MTMGTRRPVAAFFDLDNTLIHGSSLFYFVRGIAQEGMVKQKQLLRFAYENLRFKRSKTENPNAINIAAERLLGFVQGRSQIHLQGMCDRLVDMIIARKAIPQMLERVAEHQALRHDTWVVSAAPIEIADAVARKLNMRGAFGTRGAVEDGLYTGTLASETMHGTKKMHAILEAAQTYNYDLQKSFAYSDSISDLPMLSSVGRPAVINASKSLETIAVKNKWLILT